MIEPQTSTLSPCTLFLLHVTVGIMTTNCRSRGQIQCLEQCFPNRVLWNIRVLQNIVRGSARNRRINNFEIPRKIPTVLRNIAGIFVRQLVILEESRCAINCLVVVFFWGGGGVRILTII